MEIVQEEVVEVPVEDFIKKKDLETVHINSLVNLGALAGEGSEKCKEKEIPLNSPKGDIIFLKKLVLFRRMYSGKNHSAANVQVLCAIGSENIKSNIPAISARRRYFKDVFNRKKRDGIVEYTHWQALAVIFGDAPIDTLCGTEYEDGDTNNNDEIILNNPMRVASMAAALSGGWF